MCNTIEPVRLDVSHWAVRQWIKSGKLPVVRTAGRAPSWNNAGAKR